MVIKERITQSSSFSCWRLVSDSFERVKLVFLENLRTENYRMDAIQKDRVMSVLFGGAEERLPLSWPCYEER